MSKLEAGAGSPLLVRTAPLELTDRGAALRDAAAQMTLAAQGARAALESTAALRGEVRVAAVREVVRWWLLPRLPELVARHPELRLTLFSGNEVMSLAAGEADLALRWARPTRGDLVVRRLHTERYGLYAHPELERGPRTPWLGLAGSLARIPEQRVADQIFGDRPARLRFEDYESLGVAVSMGLGVALLSTMFVTQLGGMVRVEPEEVGGARVELPTRTMWLVIHRTRQDLPVVRAVIAWFDELFAP